MVKYGGVVCPDHKVSCSLEFHEQFFHLPGTVILSSLPGILSNLLHSFFDITIGHSSILCIQIARYYS